MTKKAFKRGLSWIVTVAIIVTLLPVFSIAAYAAPWDGTTSTPWVSDANHDGTESKPYEIASAANLAYLAAQVNSGTNYSGVYFVLADDIDLGNQEWTPIGKYVFGMPFGGIDNPFSGVFDGNGHTISGLNITQHNQYVGLFGYCKNAVIKKISVSGSINCHSSSIGGIVGQSNLSTISECVSSVNITALSGVVGGIVGSSQPDGTTILNCYNTGSLTGSYRTAGIIAYTSGVNTIKNCYNTGVINAENNVGGGIAGQHTSGTISHCVALNESISGTVDDIYRVTGSLIGGTTSNNYARSDMTVKGSTVVSADNTSLSGADIAYASALTAASWNTLFDLSGDNAGVWIIENGELPKLAVFVVTPNTFTVTYNGNGNTGGAVPLTSTHNEGSTVTVSSNSGTLVKTGYEFAGWNTEADGTGTTYHAGSGQIANISSDVTLYAIWSKFSVSLGNTSFAISGLPVNIDGNLVIEGFTESISGAKVMIQNKFEGDTLNFNDVGGITGTYDATAGVLTLTGSASAAQYQAALRSVTFSTISNDTTNREILFSLGGGLYYSDNGHFYEYVESLNISWTAAKDAAEARSLYGRQGYLATLTSAGENSFVAEKVTGLGWIGAKDINYVDPSSDDSLGDWRWVTGPEGLADGGNGTQFYTGYNGASGTTITYSNWCIGEPNNGSNIEYVAHIFGPRSTMPGWAGSANPGEWNDFEINRNDGAVKGYVVEYGGMPGDTPINVQSTKTIIVSEPDTNAPILTSGAVTRTSDTAGTVKFTSNEAGEYYYAVVADGSVEPAIDTSGAGIACTTDETTITNPTGLTAGAKDIYIKVKDASGNVSVALKIDIAAYVAPNNENNGGGSSSGGGSSEIISTPITATNQESVTVIVIVNGKTENAGTEAKTIEAGKTTVTVKVNNTVIDSKIDEAINNNSSGTGNMVQIPVADKASDIVKVELTGDIVKKLETNTFDVSIKRDAVEYIIPAQELTISSVARQLGVSEEALKDIAVEVKITKIDESLATKYSEAAKTNGAEIVFPPVKFEIVAKTTKSDGSTAEVQISKFSNYVERVMEIPAGVDPSKITTGVVFNPDGTYSHVPTEVFQKDGKWYAKLNSLTNSDYSVIWNPIKVKSVENHWSKDAVNDMASRLVVFNAETFEPNKAITREDFAEYIIRAPGLYREGAKSENKFKDVAANGDRTLAVLLASEYKIVSGYPDGTFRPEALITREEAMTMYKKAMMVTKLTGKDLNKYQDYTDYNQVSSWASEYVKEVLSAHVFSGNTATTISPKSNLTYAEAAQAIRNLLVMSKLINK